MQMERNNYPYLPEGKEIKYVKADNQFMKAAKEACRELSTDRHHPTGAVLVRDGRVILSSANQSAIKNKVLLALHQKGFCVRKILKISSGKKYWLCPGCASARNHAESRFMKEAKRLGIKTAGADVYLWGHWWCCEPCWAAMIAGEVRDVYLLEGSERFFNKTHPDNIIGRQFKELP